MIAKLLADAKNAAGEQAVEAQKRGDFGVARHWQNVANDCDRLLRSAVELMSRG